MAVSNSVLLFDDAAYFYNLMYNTSTSDFFIYLSHAADITLLFTLPPRPYTAFSCLFVRDTELLVCCVWCVDGRMGLQMMSAVSCIQTIISVSLFLCCPSHVSQQPTLPCMHICAPGQRHSWPACRQLLVRIWQCWINFHFFCCYNCCKLFHLCLICQMWRRFIRRPSGLMTFEQSEATTLLLCLLVIKPICLINGTCR